MVSAAVVLLGVWVTGGVLTQDAMVARALTGAWFVVAGGLALAVAVRRRELAVAVVGSWLLTSALVGGFLLVTSKVDRVVHEDVVVAASPRATSPGAPFPATPAAALLARGRFRSGAHETSGVASLVRTTSGDRVLTLTAFATSPGPDLRVYLVPHADGVSAAVDLGRLKGNKGNQQYDVPRGARAGRVVIWCRAFSVEFGSAALRGA